MASSHDQTSKLIGQWGYPSKGVWKTIPPHTLPADALFDASNVMLHNGVLTARSTITPFDPSQAHSISWGLIEYWYARGGRAALSAGRNTIEYTTGSGWFDVTGNLHFGDFLRQPSRMTLLQFGTPGDVYAVITNGVDPLMQWNGDGDATLVEGNPHILHDLITVADRVVGIQKPYAVIWGESLTLSTWPALNTKLLAETPDPVVAIRNMGTLGFAIYKDRTIWAAQFQGGPSSRIFRFDLRAYAEGPAGPAAIVETNIGHIYMTPSGRIGKFNGTQHEWLVEGLWPDTRGKIDSSQSIFTVGVYDPLLHQVYFFFPRPEDAEHRARGMVVLNLPFPEAGITDFAAFPGSTGHSITAAMTAKDHFRPLALIMTEEGPLLCTLTQGQQADTPYPFEWYIQTGLTPTPNLEVMACSVEPYLLRQEHYGECTLQLTTSYSLDTLGGNVGLPYTIDLTKFPVRDIKGLEEKARFVGLKLSASSLARVSYFGSQVYGRKLS